MGRVQYVTGKYSAIGTLNYLTTRNGFSLRYIYSLLRYFNFDKYKVGSGIPHIYFKDYGSELIYCPPLEVQNKIARILSLVEEMLDLEQDIMTNQNKISDIIALWQIDKKQYVKKSSYSAYMLLTENHLLPIFGNMTAIEETDVQAFVFQKLDAGLSQKTIKDILIVLKMILKFGVKNKMLEYSPIDVQYPTEREKHDIEVLSKTNQRRLMEYIREHFTFRNVGIYICLSAGGHIGEICALTWDDIDTGTGIISVRKTIQRIKATAARSC